MVTLAIRATVPTLYMCFDISCLRTQPGASRRVRVKRRSGKIYPRNADSPVRCM